MGCLDENSLARLVEGTLPVDARLAIDDHVTDCAECRVLVSALAHDLPMVAAVDEPSLERMASAPIDPAAREPAFHDGDDIADRYRIVRFIGSGGMGEVYEADDRELRVRVALKAIRAEIAENRRVVERFKLEIYFARKVTHPNVCRSFELGFHHAADGNKTVFLTMELLAGETLSDRIRRDGPLSTRDALPIVEQMAAALDAAHEAGVIHRDFKSPNVMLVPSPIGVRPVITDFGLARGVPSDDASGAGGTTQTGLVGSPAYMAPEQVAGQRVTAAVDLYALGVVMFEMVTGEWPFRAETGMLTALARLQGPAPSPRSQIPDLDRVWDQVILRCLARDPARRFTTAGEVVAALRGERIADGRAPSRDRGRSSRSRTFAMLALVAAIAVGATWLAGSTRTRPATPAIAPVIAAPVITAPVITAPARTPDTGADRSDRGVHVEPSIPLASRVVATPSVKRASTTRSDASRRATANVVAAPVAISSPPSVASPPPPADLAPSPDRSPPPADPLLITEYPAAP